MKLKSLIIPLINLVVFVGAGFVLFELARKPLADKPAPEADDIPLNIHTDVPVQVGTIQKLTLRRKVFSYGRIEPAPAGHDQAGALARIAAPLTLPVLSLQCVEGQRVNKGDILFTLDGRAIDARMQIDPQILAVRAPISGIISAIHINVGEMAGPAAAAVEVFDPDRLVAALDVPAADAAWIKVGAQAYLRPATQPAAIQSQVAYVDPTVDSTSGMSSVDVPVPPQSGYLPGQFIAAEIVVEQITDCLAVPAQSIVRDETGWTAIAMVSSDQHHAQMRAVNVGIRDGDMVQVQSQDLEAGQTIVTIGAAALVNRTGIHVIEP